jgi:hypothetical protein
MNIEYTATGKIELHLSDDPDQFRNIAEMVREKLAGRWTEQIDGLDQSYWDLDVQGTLITVHREHYLGVCVSCEDDAPQRLALDRLRCQFTPK